MRSMGVLKGADTYAVARQSLYFFLKGDLVDTVMEMNNWVWLSIVIVSWVAYYALVLRERRELSRLDLEADRTLNSTESEEEVRSK